MNPSEPADERLETVRKLLSNYEIGFLTASDVLNAIFGLVDEKNVRVVAQMLPEHIRLEVGDFVTRLTDAQLEVAPWSRELQELTDAEADPEHFSGTALALYLERQGQIAFRRYFTGLPKHEHPQQGSLQQGPLQQGHPQHEGARQRPPPEERSQEPRS